MSEIYEELVQAIGKRVSMDIETVVAASPAQEKLMGPVKDRTAMVCLKFRGAVDAERFRLAVFALD